MTDLKRVPAASGGSYSDAVVVAAGDIRWIYVAGQTARPPVPDDLGGQAEACFAQIAEILRSQGAELSDVVAVTVYLTDLTEYETFAQARAAAFGLQPPTSAAVGVASLIGGALVEVAAVAAARGAS